MAINVLIDTNVLVYAHDRSEPIKQAHALRVLDRLQATGIGALSVQTLSEFFNATTRRIKSPLSLEDAARQIERLIRSWIVFDLTPMAVLEATRGVRTHQFSYWDAQIWAVARLNQISIVFTEDIPSAPSIDGVRFINPFASDFDLDQW
jgi:predicted nucleic acid-binding protein